MITKGVLSKLKIGVLGSGNMGQALVRGLIEQSVYPQNIWVYDPDKRKIDAMRKIGAVKAAKNERQCVSIADVVILAVKPQTMGQVVSEIQSVLTPEMLVISIAAGISLSKLDEFLKKPLAVVRVMPNMPAVVGQGISAYAMGRRTTAKHKKIAEAILNAFGELQEVPERMLDLVTAVSGSGPAYFFLLAQKMIEGAYELGMKADIAKKLVYQTAFGSAKMLLDTADDPEDLIGRVASKGGTTEAALSVFQRKGFGKIVHEAIRAAQKRSVQMREGK